MAVDHDQWLFSPAELNNTPSIQDGMTPEEEKETRAKGVRFLQQVGILVKVPQITLATAAVFFQRFLMRASFKRSINGIPKLHHFKIAAVALFLALKVEETPRKIRDLVQAFCRVAQQNPTLEVDEQSKDYWQWRDCVLDNEDVLLETLCFDLDIESAHRILFEMLKQFKLEHNKDIRNYAWSFVLDSNSTQSCLLYSGRTIAAAALYAACYLNNNTELPEGWMARYTTEENVAQAIVYMKDWALRQRSQLVGVKTENGSQEQINYNNLPPPSTMQDVH